MKLYILIATLIVAIALPSCIYQERADWQTTPSVNNYVNSRRPNTKLTECWTSADKKTKTLNVFFPCDDVCFYKLCANINYTQSDTSYISIKGNSLAVSDITVTNPHDMGGDWSSNLFIMGKSNTFRHLWYDTTEPLEIEWKSKELQHLQISNNQIFTATDTVDVSKTHHFGLYIPENSQVNFETLICDTFYVHIDGSLNINTLKSNFIHYTFAKRENIENTNIKNILLRKPDGSDSLITDTKQFFVEHIFEQQ
ncbi:MAG: hypothetical protein K6G73_04395 [Marinilabiliaceae bacterium]|nr:hypothetical protein [Marinilabiliaceae bacterium]